MGLAKITISIDELLLKRCDRLIKEQMFSNRSEAFQLAVEEKISQICAYRLGRESAKLDKDEERAFADLWD